MATHSSIRAWKIPGTEEPGRLQPLASQSWTGLSTHTLMHKALFRDCNCFSSFSPSLLLSFLSFSFFLSSSLVAQVVKNLPAMRETRV